MENCGRGAGNAARVIAQVMNIGDFEDVLALESALGDTPLRDAITQAQAGQFNARSWHFWHYRLGLADVAGEIPPLPVRTFAGGTNGARLPVNHASVKPWR